MRQLNRLKRDPRLRGVLLPTALALSVSVVWSPGCGHRTTLSPKTQVTTNASLGELSADYDVALVRAKIYDLQVLCAQKQIQTPETHRADSLYKSTFGQEKIESRENLMLKLDHARTLYELSLARNELRLKEESVVKLEKNLQTFREIVSELEAIGRE